MRIKVQVVGAPGAALEYKELAAPAFKFGTWSIHELDISSVAGATIQILVEATDAGSGSVIEAGVDLVEIFAS